MKYPCFVYFALVMSCILFWVVLAAAFVALSFWQVLLVFVADLIFFTLFFFVLAWVSEALDD